MVFLILHNLKYKQLCSVVMLYYFALAVILIGMSYPLANLQLENNVMSFLATSLDFIGTESSHQDFSLTLCCQLQFTVVDLLCVLGYNQPEAELNKLKQPILRVFVIKIFLFLAWKWLKTLVLYPTRDKNRYFFLMLCFVVPPYVDVKIDLKMFVS